VVRVRRRVLAIANHIAAAAVAQDVPDLAPRPARVPVLLSCVRACAGTGQALLKRDAVMTTVKTNKMTKK
jgi:hypothetical protein